MKAFRRAGSALTRLSGTRSRKRRADAGIGSDAMPGHRTRQARRRSRCAFAIDGDWRRWSEAAAPAFLLAVRQPAHDSYPAIITENKVLPMQLLLPQPRTWG